MPGKITERQIRWFCDLEFKFVTNITEWWHVHGTILIWLEIPGLVIDFIHLLTQNPNASLHRDDLKRCQDTLTKRFIKKTYAWVWSCGDHDCNTQPQFERRLPQFIQTPFKLSNSMPTEWVVILKHN